MSSGYDLSESIEVRRSYEAALTREVFTDPDATHVAMGVFTTDLAEGRGDVYVAVGLGRHLERLGYEVVYLPRDEWVTPPQGTDVYLSLVAEATAMLDPLRLPPGLARVAWARNNTGRWVASPHLAAYDAVLASSERSLAELRRVYPGPAGILRIAVDEELFVAADAGGRGGVVATVNQWGGQRQLYAALREVDVDFPLAIYGEQRGLGPDLEAHVHGPVSYFALPSLYRQAAVVLDDSQDVNRGYGNVNSRVFEALACGALPVTNAALGLGAVGLADVPTYRTAEELGATVRGLLAEAEAARARAARLRDVVVAEHTYARRAEQLDAFLRTHGLTRHDGGEVARAAFPVVGFVPDYRVTNPYQDMLNARLVGAGIAALPVEDFDAVTDVADLFGDRLVLHVHWTAPVLGPATDRADADARLTAFLAALDGAKLNGGRLVWTVHNLLPHECDHPDLEARLRQGLADRADAVHVLCEETVKLAADLYTLPADRVEVIPHGSYLDVYPNIVDRYGARDELDLDPDDVVYLFLGQVRPYKGVDDLLEAFGKVRRRRPDAHLLLAGAPGRDPESVALAERISADGAVTADLGVVPDERLQLYLNAADVVVLPYRSVLNSGTLHLAWSFGRPVVAAAVGCIPHAVTPDIGVLYDPEGGDLAGAMLDAADRFGGERRGAAEQACARAARAYDYLAMASDYAALVRGLL